MGYINVICPNCEHEWEEPVFTGVKPEERFRCAQCNGLGYTEKFLIHNLEEEAVLTRIWCEWCRGRGRVTLMGT